MLKISTTRKDIEKEIKKKSWTLSKFSLVKSIRNVIMEIFLTFPQIINTQQRNNSPNNRNSEAIKCLRGKMLVAVVNSGSCKLFWKFCIFNGIWISWWKRIIQICKRFVDLVEPINLNSIY